MGGGGTWRRIARAFAAAAVLSLAGPATIAGASVLTAVSEQDAKFFDAPSYRALELNTVRLVVPWDAGARPGPWDAWIARATRDGATIMIALNAAQGSQCPQSPCVMPSPDAYRRALAELLARHPSIREITAWNEPNDNAQPTFRRPDVAAAYHDIARAVCSKCIVVAGDLLDDGSLPGYLTAYKAALRSSPMVWGLHNYLDAAYFGSTGVDTMLRETSGDLWLTETGGIVRLTLPDGDLLSYDEQRAADSMAWLYSLVAARPRIERMYVYQWLAIAAVRWDSGLIGTNGVPRPAYHVVAEHAGPRGGRTGAGAAAAARAAAQARLHGRGTLRFGKRLRLLAGGRLELKARCIVRLAATARCRQRIVIRIGGRRLAKADADVAAQRVFRRIVRLGPRARSRLVRLRPRRAGLITCALNGRRCTNRGTIAITKPLRPRVPMRR